MPQDLFGDVNLRPSSARSLRSPIVIVSILVHVAVLIALCVVPLLAVDELPIPRWTDYFLPPEVMPVVVPAPPRLPSHSAGRPDIASSTSGVPLVAPTGIAAETGLVAESGSAVSEGPPVGDTIEGLPGSVGSIEPPPPPAPRPPIRLSAGIRVPTKLVHVAPIYPAIAQAAHVEGVVIMEATIDAHGNVTDVRVLRSHPLLEQAALEAVRQWKFTPTLLSGVPVPIIMTVTVNFTLR